MANEDLQERMEWRKIMEHERQRREGLEELRRMMDATEKQETHGPKDLLKLLIKVGGIRTAEAANILMIDKTTLDNWCTTLEKRGYIERENAKTQNETIKPTSVLLTRVKAMKEKSKRQAVEEDLEEERQELLDKQQELSEERKERLALEEKLEKINDELKKKQTEIDIERGRAEELQKKLFDLERKAKDVSLEEVEFLKTELGKEHAERLKAEEELKKDRELLEELQKGMEKQHSTLMQEGEFRRRDELLSQKEQQLKQKEKQIEEEEEELRLLFGEEKQVGDIKKKEAEIKVHEGELSEKEVQLAEKEKAVNKTIEILKRIKQKLIGEKAEVKEMSQKLEERAKIIEKEEAEIEKTVTSEIETLKKKRKALEEQFKDSMSKIAVEEVKDDEMPEIESESQKPEDKKK